MKMLLAIAVMLFVQPIWALEEKIVVIVERSTPPKLKKNGQFGENGRLEQMGVVLKNNKVEITINSNFLTKTLPYHFGAYDVPATPEISKKIKSLVKAEKLKDEEIFLSRHDLTIFVNGKSVPANSDRFGTVLAIIKTLFESKKLKLIDGVTLSKSSEIKKITCEEVKNKICTFKYGYLHE